MILLKFLYLQGNLLQVSNHQSQPLIGLLVVNLANAMAFRLVFRIPTLKEWEESQMGPKLLLVVAQTLLLQHPHPKSGKKMVAHMPSRTYRANATTK